MINLRSMKLEGTTFYYYKKTMEFFSSILQFFIKIKKVSYLLLIYHKTKNDKMSC